MEWKLDDNRGSYIFRYYLPCEPTYDAAVTERRGEELIKYCLDNDISSVMLYVDLNPNWYYMPDDLPHTEYYVPVVEKLAKKLRDNNISYQLNYQNLFGSWDGGADLRYVNEWENFVDDAGNESYGCACSIGTKFRKIAGNKLSMWAKTLPDAIWIDDDIRFHHHRATVRDFWAGKTHKERFDFGCFCDKHIALFNDKNGTAYTREQIVDGITEGNELRAKWLEFSGECVDELCCWIEKTIHAVSPDTRVAIMTSKPDVHAVEGRNWQGFLHNLSTPHKPLIRPTFGPYKEYDPRFFVRSYTMVEQLKANIAAQYGTDVDLCPEIENTRFTRWAKCMAATGYQIMLSGFLGCKGITLSIFNLDGCVLEEEPEFAITLNKHRPFIDRLAKEPLWDAKTEGIALITAPDRVPFTTHKVKTMENLGFGRLWDEALLTAGIPCTYATPDRIGDIKGAAIDGFTVRILKDDEITKLLSKGVLLNAGAARELIARGFGEYIGVNVGNKMECMAGREAYSAPLHRDGSVIREPLRTTGNSWSELSLEGATALTHFETAYGTAYPGLTRFENKLGGVVYVYAIEGAHGDGFHSKYRMEIFKNVCDELCGGTVRVNTPSYSLVSVKAMPYGNAVFVSNYTADALEDIVFTAPKAVKSAVVIDSKGREHTPIIDGNVITYKNANVNMYDAVVCLIEY